MIVAGGGQLRLDVTVRFPEPSVGIPGFMLRWSASKVPQVLAPGNPLKFVAEIAGLLAHVSLPGGARPAVAGRGARCRQGEDLQLMCPPRRVADSLDPLIGRAAVAISPINP